MARTESIDRAELINTIWKARGKVSIVARAFGVSTVTIYAYAKRYATVQAALDDSRAHDDALRVDRAELKLDDAVEDGAAWAVKYTLSTKGKARGYVERQEVTGKDGGPIETKTEADLSKLSDEQLVQLEELIRHANSDGD